ncbi:hypothetical protein DFJ43DRAFT_995727 [Lentinula guzmanii]|uniref:BCAS3 WD40 domain-containing protein n=1 Tax=Lentinula guzmanii TaxID=2804957 RepID=A0AA38N0T5_9AGAR|nr:hypothetical protein DFJ43DRAFT_995727 [Lentinula guzmanii]
MRGSALSRALADPQSGKQSPRIAYSASQNTTGRIRSASTTTAIPASINGAPDEGDTIVSARWDHSFNGRRLLLLSYYPPGIQIWDCTDLGSISEILNLPSDSVRQLIADDTKPKEDTPDMVIEYAGIISQGSTDAYTLLLIYSLVEHRISKKLRIPGLSIGGGRFEVGNGFVVVSTTVPPALHILSSITFDVLHAIPTSDILPFCHKPHGLSTSHLSSRPEPPFMTIPETPPMPAPIFSVSGRLLAYASLPEGSTSLLASGVQPRTSSTLSNAAVSTASAFGSTLSAQLASLGGSGGASGALGALGGISQADVGNAALKVGGSVLSGMKTLGGLAYKSAAAATDSGPDFRMSNHTSVSNGGRVAGLANRFFSRSAPAATSSSGNRDRRYSSNSSSSIRSTDIDGYEAGKTTSNGYHVTVLDIASVTPVMSPTTRTSKPNGPPPVVMHFVASKSQPVSSMRFSASGTSLLIAPRDGQTISVYDIRIDPLSRLNETYEDRKDTSHGESKGSDASRLSPLHVYSLRRGRTPAVIESADWASDGRWLAIGTRKRTVHVFAVNPYGGPSDVFSHTSGKVKNITELPTMPIDMHPLVRLRVTKNPRPEEPMVPLAFTFLEPSLEEERRLPPNLLPPLSSPHLPPTHQHSYGSLSPNVRPRNFQDILLFNPVDGSLSLRRIFLDVKSKFNDGPSILGTSFGSVSNMGASRSLPGGNAGGRLGYSTSPGTSPVAPIGQLYTKAENGELIGRESTVASWNLRRGRDWPGKKEALMTSARKGTSTPTGQPNWLAQAELSTYSTRVLPRSIYLSHQFSFRAFGEDYHALIRQYKFDITGARIEVRKGVEVSAYPTGNSESFVDGGGFAIHYDRRRLSSSFDEPLASALTGGLDHTPSQPVLPMYPNGTPGTKPRSFKNTIPIRTMAGIGDGMSEGIGRFRREINKVRSPQLLPSSDSSLSASVPLEFDEEDEDFLSHEAERYRSHGNSQPTSPDEHCQGTDDMDMFMPEGSLLDEERDQWPGWVGEDRKAVEEAETFDDISAVGFMDEEIHAARTSTKGKSKRN